MTVREMHIEIDQSSQLVAANRMRKWYPEEKDWVLNKIQDRFIRSKLRPKKDGSGGFELDQPGADDIQVLLQTNVPLVPLIVDSERYKCILPSDYNYLISDGSRTKLLCGTTPETAAVTHFRTMLRQERDIIDALPHYSTMTLQLPDKAVVIPDDLPFNNAYAGYANLEDISFLVPWVLWKSGWYWERYDDLYKPGWYIQVQNTAPVTVSYIEIEGQLEADSSGAWVDPITNTKAYSYHTGTGKLVNNRLTPSDVIRNLRQAAFYKTAHYSPITELQNNLLWVYRDDSFIVSGVEISYIRKPQPISLSLATDCELDEGTHQIICDLAVEYLQGRVKDLQGVQLSEADLTKRVIL